MTTTNISDVRSHRHRTIVKNNSAVSTSVVLIPPPSAFVDGDRYLIVTGFSCVPASNGTLKLISGNAVNATEDVIIWQTPYTAGTRIDFAGDFIQTKVGQALKMTTETGAMGIFTLTVRYE